MEWARKIEKYLLTPETAARKAVSRLIDDIASAHREIELSTGPTVKRAQSHLLAAENFYASALTYLKKGNYSESQSSSEQSDVYVQLAVSHANGVVNQGIMLTPPDFSFPLNSAEHMINVLLDSIVGTKMAIESGNYNVNSNVQKFLIRVVKMARQSLLKLQAEKLDEAKQLTQTAMFLLSLALQSLSDDNEQIVLSIDISVHLDGDLKKHSLNMRDFVARMAVIKNALGTEENKHSNKIDKHIEEAENCFDECVAAIKIGKIELLASLIASGTMELKFAEQLLLNSATSAPDYLETRLQSLEEKDQLNKSKKPEEDFLADSAFLKYYLAVEELKEIAEELSTRDLKQFKTKIGASVGNFRDAAYHYKYESYLDAERLSKRAYYELDFARQIATTNNTPSYKELEI